MPPSSRDASFAKKLMRKNLDGVSFVQQCRISMWLASMEKLIDKFFFPLHSFSLSSRPDRATHFKFSPLHEYIFIDFSLPRYGMGTGGGAGMPLLSSDWCCSVAIKWISFFSTLLFNFSSTSDMTVIKKKMFFLFSILKNARFKWHQHTMNIRPS